MALLAVLFFVHAKLIEYAAMTQVPFPSWLRARPLVPILETPPLYAHTPTAITVAVEGVCVIETMVLAGVFIILRGRSATRREQVVALLCFLPMVGYALFARGVASADLLAYVAEARAGLACYSMTQAASGGSFNLIARFGEIRR
ncbi:MAG: hypothetical protein NVS2B3_05360 [Vulcanimicrobiaceae bacterium]